MVALGDPAVIVVAFDQIPRVVLEGQADLGLLIHEGQITHDRMGLVKVLDLGELWEKQTGLPLPLGINVTRRDLGEDMARADGESPAGAGARMTREEALEVLGLQPGASEEDVRRAHRELILKVHPDRGGSTFLAAKINEAKERIVGKHR